MTVMPSDIYTEPEADVDTLRNLGPLRPMAGLWVGEHGVDVHPTADGPAEQRFITMSFEITVTINDDGTWSYDQTTTLSVRGQAEPFLHTDRNTLIKVGNAKPNSLAEHLSSPKTKKSST